MMTSLLPLAVCWLVMNVFRFFNILVIAFVSWCINLYISAITVDFQNDFCADVGRIHSFWLDIFCLTDVCKQNLFGISHCYVSCYLYRYQEIMQYLFSSVGTSHFVSFLWIFDMHNTGGRTPKTHRTPKPTIMEIMVKVKDFIEYSGLIWIFQHSRK